MVVKEPRLNVSRTSANPLMILGVFIFCGGFILQALGNSGKLVNYLLFILGGIMFVVGLIAYVAENY